jgi:SagB-type dehydrogenase family enzyme
MMGRLRPAPAAGDAAPTIALPPPVTHGGMGLMDALHRRRSSRAFAPDALTDQILSNLLWAACGMNDAAQEMRTAPSALNAQEVDVFVALPQGTFRYDTKAHTLLLAADADLRRITGYQDFVDEAPLDVVFVADYRRVAMVPVAQRQMYAAASAGAMSQNISLYCAANGLATVLRGWIDRHAIAEALGLAHDQEPLLSQTVGLPAAT